jgi:hypothetical protein
VNYNSLNPVSLLLSSAVSNRFAIAPRTHGRQPLGIPHFCYTFLAASGASSGALGKIVLRLVAICAAAEAVHICFKRVGQVKKRDAMASGAI